MASYQSNYNETSIEADNVDATSATYDDLTVNNSLDMTGVTWSLDQYDDSSIGFSSNQLFVKDLGISDSKISDVDASKVTQPFSSLNVTGQGSFGSLVIDSSITIPTACSLIWDKYDNSSIGYASEQLFVKDLGISDAKISDVAASKVIQPFSSLSLTDATNQLVSNNAIISIINPSASQTYTLPNVGASANFIMSEGSQTINGVKTFSNLEVTALSVDTISEKTASGGISFTSNISLDEITEVKRINKGTYANLQIEDAIFLDGFLGTTTGSFSSCLTTTLETDTINEASGSGNGVTIDGFLIKDSALHGNGTKVIIAEPMTVTVGGTSTGGTLSWVLNKAGDSSTSGQLFGIGIKNTTQDVGAYVYNSGVATQCYQIDRSTGRFRVFQETQLAGDVEITGITTCANLTSTGTITSSTCNASSFNASTIMRTPEIDTDAISSSLASISLEKRLATSFGTGSSSFMVQDASDNFVGAIGRGTGSGDWTVYTYVSNSGQQSFSIEPHGPCVAHDGIKPGSSSEAITSYSETSITMTWVSSIWTTNPSSIVYLKKQNDWVTMHVEIFSGTNDGTSGDITGGTSIPSAYRPGAGNATGSFLVDDGGTQAFGSWYINGSGDLTIYQGAFGNFRANSTSVFVYGFSGSWTV